MPDVPLTWLGHAAFRFDTPGGKRVYVDPFLSGNPKTPEAEKAPERVDVILLTHGHDDHVGDTVELWQKHKPALIAQIEVRGWLGGQGVDFDITQAPNKGGTVEVEGMRVTLTNAFHSSSAGDGSYTGESCGLVIELENGTKLYFTGDTCVFGDMQLIARIYAPDVAILPIGGHFTMDPREAAVARELRGVERCIPSHNGTVGLHAGTPGELREHLTTSCEILAPEPGETVTV